MSVVDPLRAKTFGIKKSQEGGGSSEKSEGSPKDVPFTYLPKNKRGAVDEWVAVEQQKQRAIEALTQQQREEEKAAKKLYGEHLADLHKLKDIEKKQEQLNKELERQDIKAQHYEYTTSVNKLKEEEKEFKKFISESYKNQITLQKQKEIEERQRRLEEERQRISLMQKQMEEERKQKARQKLLMKREVEELLQHKKEQKDFERELQHLSQEEQRRLMEERAKKEMEREKQYKKHFQDYDKMMEERVKIHLESVKSPENSKAQQLNEWIRRNEAEYQQRLKEKEKELSEWRKANLLSTYKEVKAQLDLKEQEKEGFKKMYPYRAEENIRITQANKDYMSKLQQEKMEQQKAYSEILASQMKLKDEITSKYGTMTENERKLNNKDLLAFVGGDAGVVSMIPGISNIPSIGSKPTCRGGKAIVMSGLTNMSPTKKPPSSFSGELSRSPSGGGSPLKPQSPTGLGLGYNPITNPIPNFTQNPYILRQKQMAISARNNGSIAADNIGITKTEQFE